MPSIDLNSPEPIAPEQEKYQSLLANLQGNILKGHGRDHAVNLFFSFTAQGDELRRALVALAGERVTSARAQLEATRQRNSRAKPGKERGKVRGRLFCNLFLSATGYQQLGHSTEQLTDPHFRSGMKGTVGELNDPPVEVWEAPYQRRVDMLLLLAHDDETALQREVQSAKDALGGVAELVEEEVGHIIRNDKGDGIEPFGFVDGRSQPIFLKPDMAKEGPTTRWNPAAPLELVLTPDPHANVENAFGSYYVFRKLEQDVRGFCSDEARLADALSLDDKNRERAGAMVMGRYRDGRPIVEPWAENTGRPANDFTFTLVNETRCPFHSHIRKSNPRGDAMAKGIDSERERQHRIARRGIPYGLKEPVHHKPANELPKDGVGLLFACFQSSIEHQFSFIQSRWMNHDSFPGSGTGPDALLGREGPSVEHKWPTVWGGPKSQTTSQAFGKHVKMLGGEYFFCPSIPFTKTF